VPNYEVPFIYTWLCHTKRDH